MPFCFNTKRLWKSFRETLVTIQLTLVQEKRSLRNNARIGVISHVLVSWSKTDKYSKSNALKIRLTCRINITIENVFHVPLFIHYTYISTVSHFFSNIQNCIEKIFIYFKG